jgi:translocation and assembly module TamB
LAVLAAILLAGVRYGVLLPQAQRLIEARLDGQKIGSFGRLRIEGLSGDIWRDFSVRRLTLSDAQGVWLEADGLRMRWRFAELLLRRFHAERIEVRRLRLVRRPVLGPKGPPEPMPVSVFIDDARSRIEMLPAFSLRRGLYGVALSLGVSRRGGRRGAMQATSLLNAGDHFNLQFAVGRSRPLLILADAVEARGGALAGALGLPADQPFLLQVSANGKTSAGRFAATVISGADRPIEARGAWSPEGGQASGRISLTASTLTRAYAGRLGPEVRFSASGRKAAGDLFALKLEAESANLAVRAEGLGDPGTRRLGPRGLALTAAAPALSRITGGPAMGPARLTGVLTTAANGKGWRFAGSAAVRRLALGGYGLDEASGPVELAGGAGGVTIKAKVGSKGGRGAGWAAALLGGAPRAALEGARLKDGRLLLRELEVAGSGLRVQAHGARGLLGGLSLEGRADVFNLAAARPGASGSARLDWWAGQGRSGGAWAVKLEAAGDKFATGYAELDRLVGPRPRLTARGGLEGRKLSLERADLKGEAIAASSAGVLDPSGQLSFKLDWSAQGPFHAGAVEILGRAKGDGAISGSLSSPRVDLMADLAAVDFPKLPLRNAHLTLSFLRRPDGSSGMFAATADSDYGPARARTEFAFAAGLI